MVSEGGPCHGGPGATCQGGYCLGGTISQPPEWGCTPPPPTPALGFAAKVDFATGRSPSSIAIGDINGDGKPDLVVPNTERTVSVLLNTTAARATVPTFAAKVDFATGLTPESVAIGDINGDGKPDLAVESYDDSNGSLSRMVSVYLNTTAAGATVPTFAAKVDFAKGGLYVGDPFVIGDVNGDGKPDLAIANEGDSLLSVLLNTTAAGATVPTFAAKVDFATGADPQSLAMGDLNGDLEPDLATANPLSNTLSVLLSTTAARASVPTFAPKVDLTTSGAPFFVAIGDINGDGKPDLAVLVPSSNAVSVLLNTTAAGATVPTFAVRVDFATGVGPIFVAIGDFNGDGKLDLAVANEGDSTMSVLPNTTATGATVPTFAAKVDVAIGAAPVSIAIGDFNEDGKLDLAVANEQSDTISVVLGL
jgi:hypothetical protein